MRLGDGGDEGGGGGGLLEGQWSANPDTGVVTLTEAALARLINADPIEKWYLLDPEPIARGQFAMVYHCRHRITGEEFAAKFSSRWRLGADCTSDILHEVAVCAMLRPAQRTIHLQDVFSTERELVLVLEYAAGGDLQTLLDEDMVPYERDVISFTRQLLEGLVFIHDQSLVHLDIKPQNLVLMGEFPDCAVKLCDFEISRVLTPGREVREILGTPDYVAPEILLYEPITKKTDMWSLGVLTYVLLTGFLPFGGDTEQETFLQISRGELDFPQELFGDISPEAIDFIRRLLVREPERRMSARECLDHSWMKKEVDRPTPASPLAPVSTPTALTPTPVSSGIASPTRDVGLPPFHPNTPVTLQSPFFPESTPPVTSPVSSSSAPPPPSSSSSSSSIPRQLSRTSSRPNLDRLRSVSKSREVLSERIQMSNLKKTVSKSRERLFDAKLGLSRSRERLMDLRSFSKSVEALSALSQLNQENSVYQSCSDIFIHMLAPAGREESCRMYKSLASIDQIDEAECPHKLGYFESRFSSRDDEDFNDLVTIHNTTLNSVIAAPKPASGPAAAREARSRGGGGRRGDACGDGRCPRHDRRQPEAQPTQKIPKGNRAERMRREAQRRRKERKEREKKEQQEEERRRLAGSPEGEQEKAAESAASSSSSPGGRRRSVSHVEQRLAERHERQQERQQEKGERRNSTGGGGGRRRGSVDLERSPVAERLRAGKSHCNLGVQHERPRSATPTGKRRTKKHGSGGGEVSQASSLESVDGSLLDSPRTPTRPRRPTSLNLPEIKVFADAPKPAPDGGAVVVGQDVQGDADDEAYASLDEPNAARLLRSGSVDSAASVESRRAPTPESPTPERDGAGGGAEEADGGSVADRGGLQAASERGLAGSGELTIIHEEEDPAGGRRTRTRSPAPPPSRSRSTSAGSEASDGSSRSPPEAPSERKVRPRSLSIQPSSPSGAAALLLLRGRSRSNSVHLEPSADVQARPWGGVCDGAVARALEKFSLGGGDVTPLGRGVQGRRMSFHGISPALEDVAPLPPPSVLQ